MLPKRETSRPCGIPFNVVILMPQMNLLLKGLCKFLTIFKGGQSMPKGAYNSKKKKKKNKKKNKKKKKR